MQQLTLVYLLKDEQVCLGYKKRGHGDGYWNGFGGKTESGETVQQAAIRELREECGAVANERDLTQVALNEFIYPHENKHFLVHTFITRQFTGDPMETSEMKPQWFQLSELPYEAMWETDKEWLSTALSGTPLRCKAIFDKTGRKAISFELVEVTAF